MACAMLGKALVNNQMAAAVAKLAADGKDQEVRLKPVVPHLEPATVRGLCPQLQELGILELCWTHLAGIEIKEVSALDPRFNGAGNAVPLPPGLRGGRG
jgi:hypothetical protein